MPAFKYPPHWFSISEDPRVCSSLHSEVHREKTRFKMFCFRCVLPILALYLLLEGIHAAVLPGRNKREANWLDQEFFPLRPDRSDPGDLSVGEAEELGTFLAQAEHHHLQHHNQNQHQHNRKAHEKRRKVAPLDSIGSFQMSSTRNRKDEPGLDWGEYRE